MNFLKKITKKEIFQKVAQIANTQIKSKIKTKTQNTLTKQQQKTTSLNKIESEKQSSYEDGKTLDYNSAQKFILNLSQNSRTIRKQQIERKTKKQVFSQLQIDPIFLQECQFIQLFKMELQYAESERYERTQILHDYLNQVNQTLKKILSTQNLQILEVFEVINRYLKKISQVLTKIKLIRASIKKINVQKELKIKQIMTKKLVLKQKVTLLINMKQKQQISLIKPQNIEQVYYSQRNRHKLYNRIKKINTQNSYFRLLKSQIISISINNIQIISENLNKWINQGQIMRQKNIQKIFICLYFVKTEAIYKQNSLHVDFRKLKTEKLIKQIETVKQWKNYQYIRDPAMKGKIVDFLNILIQEIQNLSLNNQVNQRNTENQKNFSTIQ